MCRLRSAGIAVKKINHLKNASECVITIVIPQFLPMHTTTSTTLWDEYTPTCTMIFQSLPLKKGRDVAGYNVSHTMSMLEALNWYPQVSSLAKYRRHATHNAGLIGRCISTTPAEPGVQKRESENGSSRATGKGTAVKKADQFTNRVGLPGPFCWIDWQIFRISSCPS